MSGASQSTAVKIGGTAAAVSGFCVGITEAAADREGGFNTRVAAVGLLLGVVLGLALHTRSAWDRQAMSIGAQVEASIARKLAIVLSGVAVVIVAFSGAWWPKGPVHSIDAGQQIDTAVVPQQDGDPPSPVDDGALPEEDAPDDQQKDVVAVCEFSSWAGQATTLEFAPGQISVDVALEALSSRTQAFRLRIAKGQQLGATIDSSAHVETVICILDITGAVLAAGEVISGSPRILITEPVAATADYFVVALPNGTVADAILRVTAPP